MSQIVNIENVSFAYPSENKWALNGINLSIEKGEFLAVMGENGAGKTTFCKLINGIIPRLPGGKFLGTVTVDGENVTDAPQFLSQKVGMVLDDPDAQIFTSSVRYEAAFGPENLLLPPQEIEMRVKYALASAGLSGFENRRPSTLSGGEKQRLVIAAALAMKGKILVLDEPLSRLDPEGSAGLMSVLAGIRKEFQITVIMATHHSKMAAEFADRVCVLKNGVIAACKNAGDVFKDRILLDDNGIQPPYEPDIFTSFPFDNKNLPCSKTETNAVDIVNLSYSYKDGFFFNNINLSIADNDFAAVIGRNGCGKTTLLKIITGLLRPCSGGIYIRGKNIKELSVSAIAKEAGFVMQNPDNQLFSDSVYNEVSFALKNSGCPKTEIKKRVEDALRAVGLDNKDAFPHALSRADRTRVALASVLAMNCRIIIFDEVDVGQDYNGSLKIMNIARELHSRGFTVIFVTHNISLVAQYAHRLIMIDRNGIVMDRRRSA